MIRLKKLIKTSKSRLFIISPERVNVIAEARMIFLILRVATPSIL